MQNKLSKDQIESVEAIKDTATKITFILKELESNDLVRKEDFVEYHEVGLNEIHEALENFPAKKEDILTKALEKYHTIFTKQLKQHGKK